MKICTLRIEKLHFAKRKYDKRENESLMNKQTITPFPESVTA